MVRPPAAAPLRLLARAWRRPASLVRSERVIIGLDLAGTFLFALQGAALGVQARLDLLGVAVVAFVSALGGGIIRDMLIGAAPPEALRRWRYPAAAFLGAAVAVAASAALRAVPVMALILPDAAGLAIFSIAGAKKTLDHGLNPLTAVLMGGVTGAGGGVLRDLLLARVPVVLRADFYATAALAGAVVMILALRGGVPARISLALGVATCFGLRMAGVWQGWTLPRLLG